MASSKACRAAPGGPGRWPTMPNLMSLGQPGPAARPLAFFLGQSLLASTHQSATLAGHDVLRALIGSALYITLCGLFAFAAAAIIRNTAATITAMIGLLFVLPVLVNLLPWRDDLQRWLPASAAPAISATVWNSGPQNSHLFSPWGQFAVFAVYTAVLLVVGGILFRKRDA